MSDRRRARSRADTLLESADRVPAALAMGRCIEVWAEERSPAPAFSAKRRFDAARRAWFNAAGVTDTAECCRIVPLGAPWSTEYLTYRGQENLGDATAAQYVASRLAAAGARTTDIPRLRRQAQDLLDSLPVAKA